MAGFRKFGVCENHRTDCRPVGKFWQGVRQVPGRREQRRREKGRPDEKQYQSNEVAHEGNVAMNRGIVFVKD
jgi:hypothetical protein